MRAEVLSEAALRTELVTELLVSNPVLASEISALRPNKSFEPTSTPPGGRPIGWVTSGVAAAQLKR